MAPAVLKTFTTEITENTELFLSVLCVLCGKTFPAYFVKPNISYFNAVHKVGCLPLEF